MIQFRAVMHTFQKTVSPRVAIPTNKCSKHLVAGALALVLGLLVGGLNCHAMEFYWTNTTAVGNWSDPNSWFSNGVGVVNGNAYPGQGFGTELDDAAIFTNAGKYKVSIDIDPAVVGSNFFSNASNTTATVTFELNGSNHFSPVMSGPNDAFVIAEKAGSTTTVYMSSWGSGPSDGFITYGQTILGRRGCATLILTNGIFNTGTTSFGTGSGSSGHLLVYSPIPGAAPKSVIFTNMGQLNIGSTNSQGNSVVVSNGGFVYVQSTFKVGSSEDGGSSNNTVIVAEGGGLSMGGNSRGIVGKRITGSANTIGAYNNLLLVKSNATFNGKNHSFYIGFSTDDVSQGPATNNGVRVLYGGALTNISYDIIQSNNWLDLQGGVYGSHLSNDVNGAEGNGGITNFGLIKAWGKIQSLRLTVSGDIVTNLVAGGFDTNYATLWVRSSQGPLLIRNALSLTNHAILQIELGTNYFPTVVQPGTNTDSTLEILSGSILNIIDSGGFAPGTYTIFTNTCSTCATAIYFQGMSIGTVPTSSCPNCTYALSTNAIDTVLQLTVTNTNATPAASFTASPTSGPAPLVVTFTDTSTGTITNRYWDFGDENTTNTTATNLSHTYNAGTYTVSLTISGYGGSNTNTKPNYIVATNAPPVAAFSASPTNGFTPLIVTFTDSSTGAITNRFWDFGDGGTTNITVTSVGHTYMLEGSYTVSLTASGPLGANTLTRTNLITVMPCVSPPSGLVSWWPGDGHALDIWGGNNGVLTNGVTFAAGMVGQAFRFDGLNDAVVVGNPTNLQLQSFTIDAWIRRASTTQVTRNGTDGELFTYGVNGYGLGLHSNGRLLLTKMYNSEVATSVLGVTDTNLHHVAVTKSGSTVIFYVDGVAETVAAYDPGFSFTTPAAIGAEGDSLAGNFYGDIDELEIFNRALSASEIQAIYYAGSAGQCKSTGLTVNPATGFDSTGPAGGGFTPASQLYTLLNKGTNTLNWSADASAAWVSFSATNGALAGRVSTNVTVSINSNANSLPAGVYSNTVTFTNLTDGNGTTNRTVTLTVTVPANLGVAPTNGLSSTGIQGGPFTPSSQVYTLTNIGGNLLNWGASKTASWVTLSATSGSLVAGNNTTVTVSINSDANSLAAGVYSNTVTFTNLTNGDGTTNRIVILTVTPRPCVSPPLGLVSWWPGDGHARDIWGGNNGVLTNGTTFTAGMVGQAFHLDGLNDAVVVGNPTNLQLQSFTIDAWIRRASTTQVTLNGIDAELFTYGVNGYAFALHRSGRLAVSKYAVSEVASSVLAVTDTNLHHVAVTKSGSTVIFYVDGVAETAPAYDPGFSFTTPAGIGARVDQLEGNFYGDIDELEIFNRALSASEIQAIHDAAQAGQCKPTGLSVNPATGLNSSGPAGGGFTPASQMYTLLNKGTNDLNWSADASAAWVSFSATNGTLAGGILTNVTVSINSNANGLAAGVYTNTVTFTNLTDGDGTTNRIVTLTVTVPAHLGVAPTNGLSSTGIPGGPFTPSSQVYTLTNSGGNPLNWSASKTANWVTLSATGGSLVAGSNTTVTVSINANANGLAVGTYVDSVIFTNTTNGIGTTSRAVSLTVELSPWQQWQLRYFGCTNCPQAAESANPDGDGQNNLAEFLAGTDPTNSASGLRITTISREGDDIRVIWTCVGGHSYVLQGTEPFAPAGYSSGFVDTSPLISAAGVGESTTNYLDVGAAYAPVLTPPGGQIPTNGIPSTVTISASGTRGLADASSNAVSVGGLLMLGTFSISESTIQSNFYARNVSAILAAFTPYSTPFAVGDGNNLPASWDVSLSAAGFAGQKIYLLAVDKPTLAAATQLGIFTAPSWVFPDDGGEIDIDLEDVTDFVIGAQGGPLTIKLPIGPPYTFDDTARLTALPGRARFYRVRLVP